MTQQQNAALPALVLAGALMAFVVYISNVLVSIRIDWLSEDWFNYGQFTFPVAFLITDIINRLFGPRRAFVVIAVGFLGGVLFFFFAGMEGAPWPEAWSVGRIALGSLTAFVIGQVLDVSIFNSLRQRAWWFGPLVSSLVASLIDTLLFYGIAAGGSENWMNFASVDFGVKALVAVVALVPFRLVIAGVFAQRGNSNAA
jgi:hypothetical protein